MDIWNYAIGQESIRIEEVVGDEVVELIAELPLGSDKEAEAICNAHNLTTLSREDATLLGDLCFDKIDEYRKLIQTNRLAHTIQNSIKAEQDKLIILAESLSR